MVALDPRINPFRPDVAAKHLQGQVEAKRFVEGSRYQVMEPLTDLRRAPSHEARLDTQAVLGERVMIYETTEEGWAWGQLEADGYVGWLSANALGPTGPAPTHKISALRAFAFPPQTSSCHQLQPAHGRKPPSRGMMSVSLSPRTAGMCHSHFWHRSKRATRILSRSPNNSRCALSVGRQNFTGADCSGLVQVALQVAGIACPATATCRNRRLVNCLRSQVFAAEIWFSEAPCRHCP